MSESAIELMLLEILIAIIVIWSLVNEQKFVEFENRVFDAIAEKFKGVKASRRSK